MKVYEYEEKNEEELLALALSDLNLDKDSIIVKIEENEKKLFKSKKYKIKIIIKNDIKQFIKEFIKEYASKMNVDVKLEVLEKENIFSINLFTKDSSILIGKDGKNISALQILLRQALLNKFQSNIKINLDVENYKYKKLEQLKYQVKNIAQEILNTKIDVKLDSMNSYERRIVHNIINEYDHLNTESIGETPNRYVIIHYIEK